jgi:cold-inducible RNA-binding protein
MDIYVGNLAYSVNDDELNQLFSSHGTVTSARVIMDRMSGRSKGFGFVEMPDNGEAETAINALNGQDCDGRALRVNESQPKPPRDNGGGGGGGGRW